MRTLVKKQPGPGRSQRSVHLRTPWSHTGQRCGSALRTQPAHCVICVLFPHTLYLVRGLRRDREAAVEKNFIFLAELRWRQMLRQRFIEPTSPAATVLHSRTAKCRHTIRSSAGAWNKETSLASYKHQCFMGLERGYLDILDPLWIVKLNGSSVISFTLSYESF